jgi:serine phosphatase RsbU (regulator of sigma subunit)
MNRNPSENEGTGRDADPDVATGQAGPTDHVERTEQDAEQQRSALRLGAERTGLGVEELWLRYLALGGEAGVLEVEAYLQQLMTLPRMQRDLLAHAFNEYVVEAGDALKVPLSRLAPPPDPVRGSASAPPAPLASAQGPLAAVVELLAGAEQAPPEALLDAVDAAGAAVGVRFALHLVDYAQRHLVPVLTDPDRPGTLVAGHASPVESTVAGQAFRRVHTVTSGAGEGEDDDRGGRRGGASPQPTGGDPGGTWWVPLLDGNERLGVLEVHSLRAEQFHDPRLQQECEWISRLIGHLIAVVTRHGNAFDSLRRAQRRTPSAELIWNLLPPLTVATDRVVIAGQLEPSAIVGGDAFDHSVSQASAQLAVFDATGHSVASGLVVAAALAAARSVRRAGGGLFAQSLAIEEVVREEFADRGLLLTGAMAELDLLTGRLRYLVAGHPEPLLLREGRVVKSLTGGRRALFGIDEVAVTIGEEDLQPGDCVFLYTDGVTEARDADGNFFGLERLQGFLQRSASAAYPPPETVRRLLGAVLEHQQDHLEDDATVLLAQWTPAVGVADLDLEAIAADG